MCLPRQTRCRLFLPELSLVGWGLTVQWQDPGRHGTWAGSGWQNPGRACRGHQCLNQCVVLITVAGRVIALEDAAVFSLVQSCGHLMRGLLLFPCSRAAKLGARS